MGTGGKDLYAFEGIHRHSEVRHNSQFGVLFLELRPRAYVWKYLTIDGSFEDDGFAECH